MSDWIEQEEFLEYMRKDLYKQRLSWRYSYTILLTVIIGGLIYGLTEAEYGLMPNVVRVLTVGNYASIMIAPCLLVCIVECLITILYVFYPWIRHLILISVLVPVLFILFWILLLLLKWPELHLGIPCLPIVFIAFPVIAYSVERGNRDLWRRLDKLEEIHSKYKSVSPDC